MASYKKLRESDDYIIFKTGRLFSLKSHKFLTPRTNINRSVVDIMSPDGKKLTLKMHRLLAQAFIPNPNNYNEVDHINRDSLDNRLVNLRWCSHSQNCCNKGIYSNNQTGYKNIQHHTKNDSWVLAIYRQNFKYSKCFSKKQYTIQQVAAIRDNILSENNLNF